MNIKNGGVSPHQQKECYMNDDMSWNLYVKLKDTIRNFNEFEESFNLNAMHASVFHAIELLALDIFFHLSANESHALSGVDILCKHLKLRLEQKFKEKDQ